MKGMNCFQAFSFVFKLFFSSQIMEGTKNLFLIWGNTCLYTLHGNIWNL